MNHLTAKSPNFEILSTLILLALADEVIELAVTAVHEFLRGTFETCRPALRMSGIWGGPEVIGPRSKGRESPGPDSTTLLSARPIRRTPPGNP